MHHAFLSYNVFLNVLLAFGRPQDTPNSVTPTPISITSTNPTGTIPTPRESSTSTVSIKVVSVNKNADSCNKLTQAMISIKTINADTLRREGGRRSDVVLLRISQAIKTVLDVKADVDILRDLAFECSGFGVAVCDLLYVVNLYIDKTISLLESLRKNEKIQNPKREEERKSVEDMDIQGIKLEERDIQNVLTSIKYQLDCGVA